jgi:hypothetical protein
MIHQLLVTFSRLFLALMAEGLVLIRQNIPHSRFLLLEGVQVRFDSVRSGALFLYWGVDLSFVSLQHDLENALVIHNHFIPWVVSDCLVVKFLQVILKRGSVIRVCLSSELFGWGHFLLESDSVTLPFLDWNIDRFLGP